MFNGLVIAAICIVVAAVGRRHLSRAVQMCAFVGTSFTHYLVLELPGGLPNITIHRALIVTLFLVWRGWHRQATAGRERLPLNGLFRWVAAAYGCSLLLGINWQDGIKDYLSFLIENWMFYFLIWKCVQSREQVESVIRAACWGLLVVATFAVVERYTGVNIVVLLLPGYQESPKTAMDVLATYPHRILLGTAMAQGVCLIASQRSLVPSWPPRMSALVSVTGVVWCAAACYFANSRGPWLAAAMGLAVFGVAGARHARRIVVAVALLAVLGLLLRPGVADTLTGRFSSTFDDTTFKGGTYQYRWELWRVAFAHITGSPFDFLVGLGPGASRRIDQSWEISYGEVTGTQQIWSWDNEYALLLLNYGVLGLGATIALYAYAAKRLTDLCRLAKGRLRDRLAGLLAGLVIVLFMKTNVLFFAPQLTMLLWLLVACGFRCRMPKRPLEPEAVKPSVMVEA